MFIPRSIMSTTSVAWACGCSLPPMFPNDTTGRPSFMMNAGMIVWNNHCGAQPEPNPARLALTEGNADQSLHGSVHLCLLLPWYRAGWDPRKDGEAVGW
jgi:hypothetical protein